MHNSSISIAKLFLSAALYLEYVHRVGLDRLCRDPKPVLYRILNKLSDSVCLDFVNPSIGVWMELEFEKGGRIVVAIRRSEVIAVNGTRSTKSRSLVEVIDVMGVNGRFRASICCRWFCLKVRGIGIEEAINLFSLGIALVELFRRLCISSGHLITDQPLGYSS